MEVLTGRELMRLKEEYASAVVENMTRQQALSYLQQIIYNDVAVESGEAVAKKVIRAFGEEMYNSMVADITTRTSGSAAT